MATNDTGPVLGRRRFLQMTALLAGGAAIAQTASPVAGQEDTFNSWFANVSNFEGIVDRRGLSEVQVTVGAPGNGGAFAYEPAAIRVEPGTTVIWEWTGEGGSHDVAAEDGSYGSDLVGDAGAVFEYTFDAEGISKYACTPHKAMGMKGAVIVGDAVVQGGNAATPPMVEREPDYGDWFAAEPFTGTFDMRGRETVYVTVTADEAGGLAFDKPAVHVDPGTDIIWRWDADAPHGIEAADGSYASPVQSSGQWGLTFEGTGISKYATTNGEARGAIVVGDIFEGVYDVSTTHLVIGGALGAAVLSPLAFALFLWRRQINGEPDRDGSIGPVPKPK